MLARVPRGLLESEGGKLARRSSGGGAVFHDLGNLNFTFLLPKEHYDLVRQLGVIQKAAAMFELKPRLPAERFVLRRRGRSSPATRFASTTTWRCIMARS
jgi:lipoate-protein ligase A